MGRTISALVVLITNVAASSLADSRRILCTHQPPPF